MPTTTAPAIDRAPRKPEKPGLGGVTPSQWRSGIAAWLGWLFDGLDMHLYTLVATPFVAELLHSASTSSEAVKEKTSWIQAAFLVGWALGGGFFGRLGDLLGRSRALALTILTYAVFTGLSAAATTWWHLLIFRFLAALGIGGEWAVGSSLLSETWPKRWRAWIAAVLQTGVNIGVLFACVAVYLYAYGGWETKRYVFLVGIVPALIVFWIRKSVPEPDEWHNAKLAAGANRPVVGDLFRGQVLKITLASIAVCACSLTGWWAFMFWHTQHLRNLPEVKIMSSADRDQLVSKAFFLVIAASIFGNFFCAWVARLIGYRRSIAMMCLGFFAAICAAFYRSHPYPQLVWFYFPLVGFFSGMFGLFTMYLPPLFPTLLRTTGAGFCYNIGRIFAAAGTIIFALFAHVGDFKSALFYDAFLFIPAMFVALTLPDLQDVDDLVPVEEPVD